MLLAAVDIPRIARAGRSPSEPALSVVGGSR